MIGPFSRLRLAERFENLVIIMALSFKQIRKQYRVALALFLGGIVTSQAQRYQVGDIVENFTLINRETQAEVDLYDLDGKVIFLEWFAHWCPFCQAAAGQIRPGIVEYYQDRGGNPDGVPFMHVGLNLQGGQEISTQGFVDFYKLEFVLNDFDRAVANRFQPGGQPIFAIINGVANSPSHEQWELIYSRLGYGVELHPINEFREVIDTVMLSDYLKYLISLDIPENRRGEDDDPDFDGLSNVFEYYFGSDASDTASFSRPIPKIVTISSTQFQAIQYIKNPNAVGVTITAEFSDSPSFDSLNGSAPFMTELLENGMERVTVRSSTPLLNGREFGRLIFRSEEP